MPAPEHDQIVDNLRAAWVASSLDQHQLAAAMEMTVDDLALVLDGEQPLSLEDLVRFAAALDTTVDRLLGTSECEVRIIGPCVMSGEEAEPTGADGSAATQTCRTCDQPRGAHAARCPQGVIDGLRKRITELEKLCARWQRKSGVLLDDEHALRVELQAMTERAESGEARERAVRVLHVGDHLCYTPDGARTRFHPDGTGLRCATLAALDATGAPNYEHQPEVIPNATAVGDSVTVCRRCSDVMCDYVRWPCPWARAAGTPATSQPTATGVPVDLERAKDDWFHGRRHAFCLECAGGPWAHPGTCPGWDGPTDGPHLDPPCATCGRCEHLHRGVHVDRWRCATFVLAAGTPIPVVTAAMVRAGHDAHLRTPASRGMVRADEDPRMRAALEAALSVAAIGAPADQA
ncbi:hypothetical protein ACG83_10845 [Frankia sp. R43]|uniref:helix-turn-helix domain-containing protein n=1 Tax=Frankia sp. R43 TaxID=269536 RepID=UPI0006CA41CF|nr:helix-turn-helix transcriptional regulator [Frankia sp. R43]KPM55763.1 hypothetical protein ACG83_10845 [Frankia sp. R43]